MLGVADIILNGEVIAQVDRKSSERIIVRNGSHGIKLSYFGEETPTVNFTANSNRIVFSVIEEPFMLRKEGEYTLTNVSSPVANIEAAVTSGVRNLATRIPAGAKVAVVNINASSERLASTIVDETMFQLVTLDRFVVVDRKSLDVIKAEQNFQLSGDVDDHTIVEIGKLLGAAIVITGSYDQIRNENRLTLKALDVQTGHVVHMVREEVRN
jgi:TolB-like protein